MPEPQTCDDKRQLRQLIASIQERLQLAAVEGGSRRDLVEALDWFSGFAEGAGQVPLTTEAPAAAGLAYELAGEFREVGRLLESGPVAAPEWEDCLSPGELRAFELAQARKATQVA